VSPLPPAYRETELEYPPGWLTRCRRGFVSGVTMLIVAVVLFAIPTLLAWFAPGADSTSAGSALRAAVLITISGNHGGFRLDGTPVTLTPLLVTIVLAWLVATNARRFDSTSGYVGFAGGYVAATALLAHWSQIGQTRLSVGSSVLAATVFVLVFGLGARQLPRLWRAAADRWRHVVRASAAIASVYLLGGAVLCAAMLSLHLHDASAVQSRLATGAAGLPVTLIGIGATPNAVLGAVGYLAGPGFSVGAHTSVSAFAVDRGSLPAFPMLAGLPTHRGSEAVGVGLIVVIALLAGWAGLRVLTAGRVSAAAGGSRRTLLDLLCASLIAGFGLAVLATLASGSLGGGSLHHIGAIGWLVGLAIAGETALAASSVLVFSTLAQAWTRRGGITDSKPAQSKPAQSKPHNEPAPSLAVISGSKQADGARSKSPDKPDEKGTGRGLRSAG
jgi:hypothetical protein